MKNLFEELNLSIAYYRMLYRHKPKIAIIHIIYRCLRLWSQIQLKPLKEKPLNCWLTIKNSEGIDITGHIIKDSNTLIIPKIPNNSHIFFNLNKALKENPQIKRFGLVFFMGIGDYFFITSFLNYLKESYPNIKFDAYVSTSKDINNSPPVLNLLKVNPIFENVYTFNGKANQEFWKNYDYSQCYKNLPKDTLLLPMIYEYNLDTYSRIDSLVATFGLKPLSAIPNIHVPLSHNLSEEGTKLLNTITKTAEATKAKGIIFLQMTHRSTNYTYPYAGQLIQQLISENLLVICPDKISVEHQNFISINTDIININDSIKILAELKQKHNLMVLGIVSCFMAIAAGLKIPNLAIQHFVDPSLKSYLPRNTYLIVNEIYPDIPRNYCFIPTNKEYIRDNTFFHYKADFVIDCFKQFQKLI